MSRSMMKISPGMVHAHDFSRAPQSPIPRSTFNRSHGHKTTFNAGYLIPVLVDEALPGDTFKLDMTAFARLATPLFPIMDNLWIDSHFFFVPNRLLWEHWEEFNGAQIPNPDPTFSTTYILPTITSTAMTGYTEGTIYDYMGLPVGVPGLETNSLPLRAYNLIYNEWFRDENLQNSLVQNFDDGPDSVSDYAIVRRGKRYDYFTSCLPWPQKGPTVELPLGSIAPVISDLASGGDGLPKVFPDGSGLTATNWILNTGSSAPGNPTYWQGNNTFGSSGAKWGTDDGDTGLVTDLSAATAATINQLRQAFQIQRLYERDARGGTRYTEIIQAHFGVHSPDARLQRPEYLGGSSSPVNVTPVANTTGAAGANKQGTLAAFGTSALMHHGFTYSFQEHGIVLGLISARSDYTYWQGANRLWFRSTRFDYYWPAFSHLGEQAVLNREIFAQGTADDELVFGYQEAWAEYRYKPSMITSLFRPDATGTLDSWHLSQDFATLPTLSTSFISEDPPMTRIKATNTDPDFIVDIFFNYVCARPMPTYSIPGLIDHF